MLTDLTQAWHTLTWSNVPAAAQRVGGQCLLDWVGCAIAGAGERAVSILAATLGSSIGSSSLTTGGTGHPRDAALINGTAGHALDFDDTSTAMLGHPSAPVLPAVLALAEHLDTTGEQLLTAFITGVEIESRLGTAIGPDHYARGWHSTATIGVMGAAAACARLLDLDTERFATALGLAASQSAGLKANFGTMTKPFHAGSAAERGLLSALLAEAGFTANPDAFTAQQGLVVAAGGGSLVPLRLGDNDFAIIDTLFKYHASCYLTHATLHAIESLGAPRLPGGADSVVITVNPALLDTCGIPEPSTGLEAKFSLRGAAALALLGHDTADPATFTDSVVQNAEIQKQLRRIKIRTDATAPQSWARVAVDDLPPAEADTSTPQSNLDRQERRLGDKFARLVDGRIAEDANAAKHRLLNAAAIGSARNLLPTYITQRQRPTNEQTTTNRRFEDHGPRG